MSFQMPSKKTIIIASVVLVVMIAIALGIYFAIKTAKEIITPPTGEGIGAPEAGAEFASQIEELKGPKLKMISDQPVFDYWIVSEEIKEVLATTTIVATTTGAASGKTTTTTAPAVGKSALEIFGLGATSTEATSTKATIEGKVEKPLFAATTGEIFYINQYGQILKLRDNKTDEIISERRIDHLQSVKANKNGKLVIVKFGDLNSDSDSSSSQFELFNLETKVWQVLENISAVDFSPDGTKIAYLENAGDLIIKELFNTSPKYKPSKILTLNQKDFDLKWLMEEKILLTSKPSYQYASEIWAVDVKNKTMELFMGDRGLIINWAADSILGLKFKSDDRGNGSLNLIDNSGTIKANLGFSTLPDKCLIGLVKIYCALSQGSTAIKAPKLPDDYLKRAVYFNDYIYELDVDKNILTRIFNETEPSLDATHLSLFGDKLLFINRYDNKIYSLRL